MEFQMADEKQHLNFAANKTEETFYKKFLVIGVKYTKKSPNKVLHKIS
jgi:hypothetical protein